MMNRDRRGALAWVAVLVPVWLVCMLCTHWEPILRDGWGHLRWHLTTANTPSSIWLFAKNSYLGGNPRLGQTVTLLLMTPGPYHAIVTPIVELAMFGLLATLVLGRAPSWRRADDALLYATIIAIVMLCSPQSGTMLFYRPFTGNYLYGFAWNLALLVPYRLHAAAPRVRAWWSTAWTVPVAFVVGAIAGLCNEHTPPAIAAIMAVCAVVAWRRDRRIPAWMIAGALGLVAGWIAILLAPGQALRYSGLANQESTVDRIADRGFLGDIWIVARLFVYLAPTIPWLVIAAIARARGKLDTRVPTIVALVGVGAALVIALTLLGSPKEGQRLYFAACALAAAGAAGWITAQAVGARWTRLACTVLTAGVLAFVGWRLLSTYATLDDEYRARRAALDAARNGATVVLPRYSVAHGWWTLGEDFEAQSLRTFVGNTFNIKDVELAPK